MKTRTICLLLTLLLLLSGCGPKRPAALEPIPDSLTESHEVPSEPDPEAEPALEPEPNFDPEPELELDLEPAPEPAAEKVRYTALWKGKKLPALSNGKTAHYSFFSSGDTLRITAEVPVSSIYIRWYRTPTSWTLRTEDNEQTCGQTAYLHEVVRLEAPSKELTLVLPGTTIGGYQGISELEAYTSGSLPATVQDWQEPPEQADVLVLPTHSDDEFVFFGGVIPKYLDAGYTVQVAYLVDHRDHERLDSLWEAGIRNYPLVSERGDKFCSDQASAETFYGVETINAYLTEAIRRFRPLVIVGQAEHGESGHAVHIFYVNRLKEAVELAADASAFPESAEQWGTWDTPKTYLHLYGDNPVTLDYETPLESFGGRTAFEVAQDAFKQCVSQFKNAKYRVYSTGSKFDSHIFGLYRSLVGEDETRDDLFEHIPADYRSNIA